MYIKREVAEVMKNSANPFMLNHKIPVTRGIDLNKMVDRGGVLMPRQWYMERDTFVSVYYSKPVAERVMNLSDRAQRLYLYLLYNLRKDVDYIVIDPAAYMETAKIKSQTTFKLARMELADQGFISKANPLRTYWINPARFFLGNRPAKYPKNLEVKYEL